MLSPQEFAAAWGLDCYCFPPDVFQDVDIPESARAFLREAGLPLRAEVQMDLYTAPLPLVPAFPPMPPANLPLLSRYPATQLRVLSYVLDDRNWPGAEYRENGVYYAIEEKTGHIYRVGPRMKRKLEQAGS